MEKSDKENSTDVNKPSTFDIKKSKFIRKLILEYIKTYENKHPEVNTYKDITLR